MVAFCVVTMAPSDLRDGYLAEKLWSHIAINMGQFRLPSSNAAAFALPLLLERICIYKALL